jgi:hypothetical protein
VPKTPARHDFGRVTDACRGVDDGRVGSHQLINPDLVRVPAVRDRARDVSVGDDADRLAGLRLRDDEGGRIRALHHVGGCGHVVVLLNRRDRWLHDVRDRGRGRRRRLYRGVGHDLLLGRPDHTVRYSITPFGPRQRPACLVSAAGMRWDGAVGAAITSSAAREAQDQNARPVAISDSRETLPDVGKLISDDAEG